MCLYYHYFYSGCHPTGYVLKIWRNFWQQPLHFHIITRQRCWWCSAFTHGRHVVSSFPLLIAMTDRKDDASCFGTGPNRPTIMVTFATFLLSVVITIRKKVACDSSEIFQRPWYLDWYTSTVRCMVKTIRKIYNEWRLLYSVSFMCC